MAREEAEFVSEIRNEKSRKLTFIHIRGQAEREISSYFADGEDASPDCGTGQGGLQGCKQEEWSAMEMRSILMDGSYGWCLSPEIELVESRDEGDGGRRTEKS